MPEPELPKQEGRQENSAPLPGSEKRHKRFILAFWKSALEKWPEIKPWVELLKGEWEGMKKGFFLFILLVALPAIGITIYATHKSEKNTTDALLSGTNIFFSRSNSFLLGMIQVQNGQISGIQKQLDDYKRDTEAQIINLKLDIQRITGERDNALHRIVQLESLPETALLAYSNVLSFSNLLDNINIERPTLQVRVNGVLLTNVDSSPDAIVSTKDNPIQTSRDILITVNTLSKLTAHNVAIDFLAAIDPTNLVADGWQPQPRNSRGENHWNIVSNRSVTQVLSFQANVLKILPSFKDKYLLVLIYARADNSISYEYIVNFVFPE